MRKRRTTAEQQLAESQNDEAFAEFNRVMLAMGERGRNMLDRRERVELFFILLNRIRKRDRTLKRG